MIDDLSVSLVEGEALGVVGPNGAGKTTLLNLITGTVPSRAGQVVFAGADSHQLARTSAAAPAWGGRTRSPDPSRA